MADESPRAAALYRLELTQLQTVLTRLTISNGIGWSPEGTTMYLADSGTRTIDAFDFAPAPATYRSSHHRQACDSQESRPTASPSTIAATSGSPSGAVARCATTGPTDPRWRR